MKQFSRIFDGMMFIAAFLVTTLILSVLDKQFDIMQFLKFSLIFFGMGGIFALFIYLIVSNFENKKKHTISYEQIEDYSSDEKLSYSRADIIHALTYGHMEGRKGIPHHKVLQEYKEINNL